MLPRSGPPQDKMPAIRQLDRGSDHPDVTVMAWGGRHGVSKRFAFTGVLAPSAQFWNSTPMAIPGQPSHPAACAGPGLSPRQGAQEVKGTWLPSLDLALATWGPRFPACNLHGPFFRSLKCRLHYKCVYPQVQGPTGDSSIPGIWKRTWTSPWRSRCVHMWVWEAPGDKLLLGKGGKDGWG